MNVYPRKPLRVTEAMDEPGQFWHEGWLSADECYPAERLDALLAACEAHHSHHADYPGGNGACDLCAAFRAFQQQETA